MKTRQFSLRVIFTMMLATVCCLQSFAGGSTNSTYYGKAKAVAAPKGAGKVYVGTTQDGALVEDEATATTQQSATSAPTFTFYASAEANEGYEFAGWANNATTTDMTSEEATNYEFTVTGTTNRNTTKTIYARFKQQHHSRMTVIAEEGGKVYVSAAGNLGAPESRMSATIDNEEYTFDDSEEHTYYIWAVPDDGYEFLEWVAEDGSRVSNVAQGSAVIEAESATAGNATIVSYTARFARPLNRYSQALAHTNNAELGMVYVSSDNAVSPSYSENAQTEVVEHEVATTSPYSYWYYAQTQGEDAIFKGWSTNREGTQIVSSDNPYNATGLATSEQAGTPTTVELYAIFANPERHYAEMTITSNDSELGLVAISDRSISYKNYDTELTFAPSATLMVTKEKEEDVTFYVYFKRANENVTVQNFESAGLVSAITGSFNITSSTGVGYKTPKVTAVSNDKTNPSKGSLTVIFYEQKTVVDGKTLIALESATTPEYTEGQSYSSSTETKNYVELTFAESLVLPTNGEQKGTVNADKAREVVITRAGSDQTYKPSQIISTTEGKGRIIFDTKLMTTFVADTYTIHIPAGLFNIASSTSKLSDACEPTFTVVSDGGSTLTLLSSSPSDGATLKGYTYTSDNDEHELGQNEFDTSASSILFSLVFQQNVTSISEEQKANIRLVNEEGVSYRLNSIGLPAISQGKVDGRVNIVFPALVDGNYTLTIPEGTFTGATKANEEINLHFTVTGSKAEYKIYQLTRDAYTPNADVTKAIEVLDRLTVSYKGEFGNAAALVGDASGITIRSYVETITDPESETPTINRNYSNVATTATLSVEEGKMVVTFSPAIQAEGYYEVNIPAGIVANMEAGDMTLAQKVSAGYAENPAHTGLTFHVVPAVVIIPGDGDANGDGRVSVLDLTELIRLLQNKGYDNALDMNGNGLLDLNDVNAIVDIIIEKNRE